MKRNKHPAGMNKKPGSMAKLTENISRIFRDQGKAWLASLPDLVRQLSIHWDLGQLAPVDNMTFNYVLKAVRHGNIPVILKISCDEKSLSSEIAALRYFHGRGCVRLVDEDISSHAMLLQQAIPGITLKSLYPAQIELVMDQYAATMNKLLANPLPQHPQFDAIDVWLKVIDTMKSGSVQEHLLQKAIILKNELLRSMGQQYVLHGDLHHDNILDNTEEWIAIDPKGIIGDAEFEAAAFDFIHASEMQNENHVRNLFMTRTSLLAQKANLNPHRLRQWTFVRLVLSAAWSLEDDCDPGWAIRMAEMLALVV
ncbi:hypothetical protein AQUSIP_09180 [Aquicella siphonis]|uniref:Aminoglycoside/hydroxyurea antibiotic resistance kinase n=1 Tax=Aquicella siphonis TaxID=254247 RepID=A0A5E4PGI1_9COXI|nr:aminoglycoside phosphotransferase family protein [Aquicella siphonis]VVC75628.1 hypothetical protein AQUSIP_09180 [Aquicella siphonis]